MPLVRIMLKLLLHQHRHTIEALAHIGVAGRQPNPRTRRDWDHRRRLFFARALSSADTVAESTEPVMRIRPPVANSISTVPGCSDVDVGDGRAAIAGSCAMATALNAVTVGSRLQSCCRQRNSWLVCIPASRATSDATAPGSSAAATIRSFSARDQRRRRCTDVITSICALVIVLALGLVLGLATNTQLRKAAFTECVPAGLHAKLSGRQGFASSASLPQTAGQQCRSCDSPPTSLHTTRCYGGIHSIPRTAN